MERVDPGDGGMDADDAVEREDGILVGVGDEQRARGDQGGELPVVPAVGVHHEHAVAVALDRAVDDVVAQIGDARHGHGDADALVERGGVPRVSAAAGAARHADARGVDLGTRLQVVDCAHAVPSLDAGRGIAARVPPVHAEPARAVVHALELAELDRIDREADVAVAREPRAVVLVAGLVAEAQLPVLNHRVSAGVEDGGSLLPAEVARHPEVGGDVEARQRLEMKLLDRELGVLDAAGHDRLQVRAFRQRREPEHLQQLLAVGGAAGLPVVERADLGERGLGEPGRLRAEVVGEHEVGRTGRGGGRGGRTQPRCGEKQGGDGCGETAGGFHAGRGLKAPTCAAPDRG